MTTQAIRFGASESAIYRGHWPVGKNLDRPDTAGPGYQVDWKDIDWKFKGSCNGEDPELFYPKQNGKKSIEKAMALCADCPVRDVCLEYGVANDEEGIWGGTNERNRERILSESQPPLGHGTQRKYKQGCRCAWCRKANTDAERARDRRVNKRSRTYKPRKQVAA